VYIYYYETIYNSYFDKKYIPTPRIQFSPHLMKKIAVFLTFSLFTLYIHPESPLDSLGYRDPLKLHKQLTQTLIQAIESGIDFEKLRSHLEELILISEFGIFLLSWKNTLNKSYEHLPYIHRLYKKCLKQHTQKKLVDSIKQATICKNLIDSIEQVIAGEKIETKIKKEPLSKNEEKMVSHFRASLYQNAKTMIEQGGSPEKIQYFLEKEFPISEIKKFVNAADNKMYREKIQEIDYAQQIARKKPSLHRSFIASFLLSCLKASPEKKNECITIAMMLSNILCGDLDEDFILSASEVIPKCKKNSLKSLFLNYNGSIMKKLEMLAKKVPVQYQ